MDRRACSKYKADINKVRQQEQMGCSCCFLYDSKWQPLFRKKCYCVYGQDRGPTGKISFFSCRKPASFRLKVPGSYPEHGHREASQCEPRYVPGRKAGRERRILPRRSRPHLCLDRQQRFCAAVQVFRLLKAQNILLHFPRKWQIWFRGSERFRLLLRWFVYNSFDYWQNRRICPRYLWTNIQHCRNWHP